MFFSILIFSVSVVCSLFLYMACNAWEKKLIEETNYICYRIVISQKFNLGVNMIGDTVYFLLTHHHYSKSKHSVDYKILSGTVISVDSDCVELVKRKMAIKVKTMFTERIIFAHCTDVFTSYDNALMHMNKLILGKA